MRRNTEAHIGREVQKVIVKLAVSLIWRAIAGQKTRLTGSTHNMVYR